MGNRQPGDATLLIDLQCEHKRCVCASLSLCLTSACVRYDDSVLANVRRLQAAYGAPVARKGKAKMR
jgi:hypothetical protein